MCAQTTKKKMSLQTKVVFRRFAFCLLTRTGPVPVQIAAKDEITKRELPFHKIKLHTIYFWNRRNAHRHRGQLIKFQNVVTLLPKCLSLLTECTYNHPAHMFTGSECKGWLVFNWKIDFATDEFRFSLANFVSVISWSRLKGREIVTEHVNSK